MTNVESLLRFNATRDSHWLKQLLASIASINHNRHADHYNHSCDRGTADSRSSSPISTVADGGHVEISGIKPEAVTFVGTAGTLEIKHSLLFGGEISGLSGSDALDLSDIRYGANSTVGYVGTPAGGILTVTDGSHTAKIHVVGNYLASGWTLGSDGKGGTTVVDPYWQTVKIGGGGSVTGISVAKDGTTVARTDTNGAYLWTGSHWQHLLTTWSMPAAFDFSGGGVYEIQVAPSNSSIMYMTFDGAVFKSGNKGTTWAETGFASFNDTNAHANDVYRMNGQKMAVDPHNPNIVYVGTPSNGLFVTHNGGQTWSHVSAIPAAAGQGITGIVFDPAVGGVVNGATQTIFASSYGHGVYESTNGGRSWSALSGGPANVEYAAVSSTGVYYAAGNANSGLWSRAAGRWTQLISANNGGQGIHAVAVDPANPNKIVAFAASGVLNISFNAGHGWTGNLWSSNKVTSADIPWLTQAQQVADGSNYLAVSGAAPNPANPGEIILAGGTGVWTTMQVPTTAPTSKVSMTWTDQAAGIENLVASDITVPPGGNPVLGSYDRPFHYLTNPNVYPSTYGPVDNNTIIHGFSVDYASFTHTFIAGIADWWGTEASGYSTNGGRTWTKFATELPGGGSTFIGGSIAASTPQNIVWAPAGGKQPSYTLNGASTWHPVVLPGVSSWSNFDKSWYYTARTVTADRVLAKTFYLYDPGEGVFSTKNGGQSWSKVYAGYLGPSYDNGYNSEIKSVPGEAGHLFYTGGPAGNPSSTPANEPFYRSTNGGVTWTAVPNVLDVFAFGFGAPASGQSYPSVYIAGYVNKIYGVWQSITDGKSWTKIGTFPTGEVDRIDAISGDPNHFGQVYVGFAGGGYAYLPAATTTTVATVATRAMAATADPVAGAWNSTFGTTEFVFDSALTGKARKLHHFTPDIDKIVLSASDFPGIGHVGHELAAAEFHMGRHATKPWQHIIYNPHSGFLFYHPQGEGATAQTHFATVGHHLALTHADFLVVA